MHAKLKII